MRCPRPVGHEDLDRLPDQLVAAVAEQALGLRVDQDDASVGSTPTIASGAASSSPRNLASARLRSVTSRIAAEHQDPLVGVDGGQRDLGGKLAAVLAPGCQLHAGAHRPGRRVGQVVVASLRVDVPHRFRDEELHGLSLELVTAVAEQSLRLGVDQGDTAVAVDRHDGVRGRVEEATEPLLDDGAARQDRVALLEEGERLVEVGALLVELPLEPGEVDAPFDLEAAEPARRWPR